jgi:hypothetical protein
LKHYSDETYQNRRLSRVSEAQEVLLYARGQGRTSDGFGARSLRSSSDLDTTAHTLLARPVLRLAVLERVGRRDVRVGELGIEVGGGLVALDDRLEGGRHLLIGEGGPVDRLKKRVLLEVSSISSGAESVLGVPVEELRR